MISYEKFEFIFYKWLGETNAYIENMPHLEDLYRYIIETKQHEEAAE